MSEETQNDIQNPVRLFIGRPQRSSRWLALATLLFFIPKFIILIPHLFVLYFLNVASFAVGVAAQFIVLVTGSYPQSMHEFMVGTLRWQIRMSSYMFGLVDKYPSFSLKN